MTQKYLALNKGKGRGFLIPYMNTYFEEFLIILATTQFMKFNRNRTSPYEDKMQP